MTMVFASCSTCNSKFQVKKTKLNQVTSEIMSLSLFKKKLPAVTIVTADIRVFWVSIRNSNVKYSFFLGELRSVHPVLWIS